MVTIITSRNVALTFKPPSARQRSLVETNARQLTATPMPQPPIIQFDVGPAPNPNDPQYLVDLEAWRQQVGFIYINHLTALCLVIDAEQRDKALAFLDELNSDTSDIDEYIKLLEDAGNSNPLLDYQSYVATMMQCDMGNHPSVRYVYDIACQNFVDFNQVMAILDGKREEDAVINMAATF